MIFPYIRKMVKAKAGSIFLSSLLFETISFPVSQLKADHAHEGERFPRIVDLTNHYTPPADACASFKATYEYLKAFEQDLHRHIHLENNILFSKAVQLEEDLATHD
ncbi:MAG TPA: hemerythrin domain-containing protein [Ohtaekwangia sp.]|nr:hemerythrin domain-containing protein [Ohtaekwangia sp.]